MSKLARNLKEALRIIAKGEDLPLDPVERARPGVEQFLGWLFSRETLEMDEEELEKKGASFFKWLWEREELPEDTPEKKGSKGFFRWLLEKEQLPWESPGEPGE